jgi:hypothetical protein
MLLAFNGVLCSIKNVCFFFFAILFVGIRSQLLERIRESGGKSREIQAMKSRLEAAARQEIYLSTLPNAPSRGRSNAAGDAIDRPCIPGSPQFVMAPLFLLSSSTRKF